MIRKKIWKEQCLHNATLFPGLHPVLHFLAPQFLLYRIIQIQSHEEHGGGALLFFLPLHLTLMKCQAVLTSAFSQSAAHTLSSGSQGLLDHSVYKVRKDKTIGIYPFLSILLYSFCFSFFLEPAPSSTPGMHL